MYSCRTFGMSKAGAPGSQLVVEEALLQYHGELALGMVYLRSQVLLEVQTRLVGVD